MCVHTLIIDGGHALAFLILNCKGSFGHIWFECLRVSGYYGYGRCLKQIYRLKLISTFIYADNLELLTYKASVASYLYGRKFKYAVRATERLEKEDNMELYSFLQLHILNSVGFYSRKRST